MKCQQCGSEAKDHDYYLTTYTPTNSNVVVKVEVTCPDCGAEYVANKFDQNGEIESWYLTREGNV